MCCLPEKYRRKIGHVDHEHFDHHLEALKKAELECEADDDSWNEDLGIDSDSEYHMSRAHSVASSHDSCHSHGSGNDDNNNNDLELSLCFGTGSASRNVSVDEQWLKYKPSPSPLQSPRRSPRVMSSQRVHPLHSDDLEAEPSLATKENVY